eukprot:TRINITY_DN32740_c0_g1_i1.p1 TRINITY_DN32740_c0_g1~~TRINITY_DN32740_c0_g1_i1.p1  ORF type:complete len:201 (-),score=44.31 TRINITY_DN32740_c0_g1_i1:328-891(-)
MDRQPMSSASSLYQSVINDVIGSVRESFLDESVDENVLMELRNLWQQKLEASKAVESQNNQHNEASVLDSKMAAMRRAVGGMGNNAAGGAAAPAGGGGQQQPQHVVISDPNRLVPVQITIPAQQNNPNSQPRALTVQVPAHALQQGSNSGSTLQQVLTAAITVALAYPQEEAARYLQQQIDIAFRLV